ncbi:MAG: phospholipase [Gammaproteobacteria bacterium CG_4_10_14_0_8_um_filter_38_16]|nr:MAG: phospholipase [Gammaproteobacteria bacterium CG_4_10_14_0_8_um_filter_38_16]PJA04440.1 MAG: phospholipase [Gammaproteobacteria bacterium CG_4_10_14_0_2_um_filter_38_22]PJB11005.1 MAG: phospholipase [Gammaproteobacteria bacterium CG_4_9_14_3_um_filter_38_9]
MKRYIIYFLFFSLISASFSTLANHEDLSDKPLVSTYKPIYILPFYYTETPSPIYIGTTPDNQKIQNTEFKFQLSFRAPIAKALFRKKNTIYLAYTQDSFWQAYNNSPFFRENDYEPQIFMENKIKWHLLPKFPITRLDFGAIHQSNGRGGIFERSWNRLYGEVLFKRGHFSVAVKGWYIFHDPAYEMHNPDIQHYMGYGNLLLSYYYKQQIISLESYNNAESGFKRGSFIVNYSFPLVHKIKGFLQFFSGYGQSLIEYNHRTNAFGIGIAI